MNGMEVVPILCLLFPGVAASWFAAQSRQAAKEEPRNVGAEIVLPTTARSPNDDISQRMMSPTSTNAVVHLSLEDTEDSAQSLKWSPHTGITHQRE